MNMAPQMLSADVSNLTDDFYTFGQHESNVSNINMLSSHQDSSDSEDLSPRQTSSFTAALSELTISEDQSRRNLRPRFPETLHNNSISSDNANIVIRIKAQDTMVETTFGAEILQFQGKQYCAGDISLLYKKDCRTWLWKGQARNFKKAIMSDMLKRGSSFIL